MRRPARRFVLTIFALSSVASAACQGREITHAAGVTCVPRVPQRVVVLDAGPLDTALALGVKPVGAVSKFADSDDFVSYLQGRTSGIQNMGIITQPSLERILALKPDLILSSKVRHGELYAQLSRIAPTVLTESVGATWRETLLTRFRVRAKTVGQRHPNVTVSVVCFLPGETRITHRASFIGTILDEAGLSRPASQRVNDFAAVVSAEAIPQMDASSLFSTTWGDPKTTTRSEMTGSPLWRNLGAVKANRAFDVDDSWMTGTGILAANRVLDGLEKYLR